MEVSTRDRFAATQASLVVLGLYFLAAWGAVQMQPRGSDGRPRLDGSPGLWLVASLAPPLVTLAGGLIVALRHRPLVSGLRPTVPTGLAAFAAALIGAVGGFSAGATHPQDLAPGLSPSGQVVWAFLWVGLGVPFVEEFFFRGVLQAALQRALHPALAVAGSALAFGLAHLEPSLVLMALPLGVLCGAITAWSGSIWPAVAAHVAWNLATISASYVPSAELRLGRLVPIVAVALTVGLVWRRRPS